MQDTTRMTTQQRLLLRTKVGVHARSHRVTGQPVHPDTAKSMTKTKSRPNAFSTKLPATITTVPNNNCPVKPKTSPSLGRALSTTTTVRPTTRLRRVAPPAAGLSNKPLLVLDMDETLVHTTFLETHQRVACRPYLDEFLTKLSKS